MSFFSFYKNREQEGRTGPIWGADTSSRGRMWIEGVGGQIWCKYCVHMYVNGKIRLLKLFQEWEKRGKGEFSGDIL
jgi:hypothetical protein